MAGNLFGLAKNGVAKFYQKTTKKSDRNSLFNEESNPVILCTGEIEFDIKDFLIFPRKRVSLKYLKYS